MTEREQKLAAKVKELEDELTQARRRLRRHEASNDDIWQAFVEKIAGSQSKFSAEAKNLLGES